MFRGDAVFHNILTGSQARKRDSSQPNSPHATSGSERNVCTNADKDKERDCMMRRATEYAQTATVGALKPPSGPTSPRGSDITKDRGKGPYHEGYLKKKGEHNPIWKRRWFVLKDYKVSYYEDQTKARLLGTINLIDSMLVRISPPSSHLYQALNLWNPNRYFQIDLPLRTYYFYADSIEDCQSWIDVLLYCTVHLQKQKISNSCKSPANGVPATTVSQPALVGPAASPSVPAVSHASGSALVLSHSHTPSLPLRASSVSSPAAVPETVFAHSAPPARPLQLSNESFLGANTATSQLPTSSSRTSSDGSSVGSPSHRRLSVTTTSASVIPVRHSTDGSTLSTISNLSPKSSHLVPSVPLPAASAGGYVDIEQARATVPPPVSASSSNGMLHASLMHSASSPAAFVVSPATESHHCEIDLTHVKFLDDVGEGCFGKVYRSVMWEKEVAVKVLKDQYNSKLRSELENEVAVLKSLRHPNCVLFIGYSRQPFAIVTEYMANGSLYGLIHNPAVRLTSSQMIKITVEIALAMNYLHQHDPIILHRDLKSSNVLISESWNVKVSDFGLAELRDAQGLPAHCGAIQWRAPEVSENFFHPPGDVFSFGVTVWELLTRKKPFDGVEPYEVMRQVREGKRPPIPESDAAGLQADLIQRCWAQDPALRPSFQQILEYLKPLIDDDINVMQLRSHAEVYLNDDNEEHAAIKFLRKSRQGFYHQLPSSVMYCRVWSTMFNAGTAEKGVAWLRSRFYSLAAENATSCFCLVNEYGKAKLYLGYGTQEQLKLTDSFVGASALPQVTSMFAELKPMLCTPLIRENLELVQFNLRPDKKPKVAQLLYATLAHDKSRAYEAFEKMVSETFAHWPNWLGSLLVSDHSTGAFSLISFFPSMEELQQLERSGALQKLILLFKDFYASMPVIEHYRVEIFSMR